jgi:hypothetical protein
MEKMLDSKETLFLESESLNNQTKTASAIEDYIAVRTN